MTHEVMSLIHQEKGKHSYPWTLYTSLETHHETGDACVICSRLHKHGPDWSTGVHSEVFNHARAVALGANIEMTNDYAGADETLVIGLNIQATGGARPMQYGIQVHDHESHPNTFKTSNGCSRPSRQTNATRSRDSSENSYSHSNTPRTSSKSPLARSQARIRAGRKTSLSSSRRRANHRVPTPPR